MVWGETEQNGTVFFLPSAQSEDLTFRQEKGLGERTLSNKQGVMQVPSISSRFPQEGHPAPLLLLSWHRASGGTYSGLPLCLEGRPEYRAGS